MKSKRSNWQIPLVLVGVTAVGVLGMLGGAAIAGTVSPLLAPSGVAAADGQASTPMPVPTYAKNARGQTYGSIADAPSEAQAPELVLVVATNGQQGYALQSDLSKAEGSGFTSPDQALAWQDANVGKSQSVPVYKSDGVTVVGEFVVAPGHGEAH